MALRDLLLENDPAAEAAALNRTERNAIKTAADLEEGIPLGLHKVVAPKLAVRGLLTYHLKRETIDNRVHTTGRWRLTERGRRVAAHITRPSTAPLSPAKESER